jgi:hypothetical protein
VFRNLFSALAAVVLDMLLIFWDLIPLILFSFDDGNERYEIYVLAWIYISFLYLLDVDKKLAALTLKRLTHLGYENLIRDIFSLRSFFL